MTHLSEYVLNFVQRAQVDGARDEGGEVESDGDFETTKTLLVRL